MSILGVNTKDVELPVPVPAGNYAVTCVSAKCRDDDGERIVSKENSERELVKFAFKVDDQNTDLIFYMLMSNIDGDSEEFVKMNQQKITRFARAFGVEELDIDELCETVKGETRTAVVGIGTNQNGDEVNEIRNWL